MLILIYTKNAVRRGIPICLIFAQNIDCGYTLEPPWRGGSNEYPQSMFWSKNKTNMYTPANPIFSIYKWGMRGYTCHGHVFLMDRENEAKEERVTRGHNCGNKHLAHAQILLNI